MSVEEKVIKEIREVLERHKTDSVELRLKTIRGTLRIKDVGKLNIIETFVRNAPRD